MLKKLIIISLAIMFSVVYKQGASAQNTVVPTPTPQSESLYISPTHVPSAEDNKVSTHETAPTAAQVINSIRESLIVPFTVPGNLGVDTSQVYSGEVTINISDGGQSAGIALNDAFYLYVNQSGQAVVPQHVYPFYLFIDHMPAPVTIGHLPDYQQDHIYSFKVDLGATPRHINFAIGDTFTTDNEGSFTVVLSDSDTTILNDSDKDGIWDHWESQGGGIDANSDGQIDLDLYTLGARPDRQDIFLEIDWFDGRSTFAPFHSHQPNQESIDAIIQAFDKHNITLHAKISDIGIPETDLNRIVSYCGNLPTDLCPQGAVDFDDIKTEYFGNPNDSPIIKDAKSLIFHYALFVDHVEVAVNPPSGRAEILGNDLMVGIGCFTDIICRAIWGVSKTRAETGTLMHELGHNLGLRHGGSDDYNYKPNYISVMNYFFQSGGIKSLSGEIRYDYSNEQLNDLDEYHLRESTGIGNVTDQTYYTCDSPNGYWIENAQTNIRGPIPGNEKIDWNCVVDPIPEVSTNINRVNVYLANGNFSYTKYDDTIEEVGGDQIGDINDGLIKLMGHDDWGNLQLNFRNDWDWLEGYHIGTLPEPELDAETAKLIVHISNLPPAANPGGPYNTGEGDVVQFDGTSSVDPNGNELAYNWDFGDGSVGNGITATHIYLDNGNYPVTLTVTNSNELSNTQVTTVTVANISPTVEAGMNLTVIEGDIVSLTVGFTDPGMFDTHIATIDWGDGVVEAGTVDKNDNMGTVTGSHVFTKSGTYPVKICVTDDDGAVGCNTFMVDVKQAQQLIYLPIIAGD